MPMTMVFMSIRGKRVRFLGMCQIVVFGRKYIHKGIKVQCVPIQRHNILANTSSRSNALERICCSLKNSAPAANETTTLPLRTMDTIETIAPGECKE